MTPRLRPMRLDDRPALVPLLQSLRELSAEESAVALEMFDEAHGTGGTGGTGDIGGVFDALCDYEFLGAFDDEERLLGYGCFGPTPATEGTFDLYWLAVSGVAQRGGVGRALLRRIEATIAERDGRLVLVETSSRTDYAPARAFYARNGYTESARVRDFYAPADDRIMLTTRLTGRATR